MENELDRLSDLYSLNLLDTFTEERFDRLVRLAKKALGTEMCYLALIDEHRQWFKSKCGISRDETGREISFCGHTIAQDDLLIVADTHQDSRFAKNPMVTGEPHIRFYAGYPLKGPKGHNIGTFCVACTAPHELTSEERQLLVDYANLAQRELNLLFLIEAQGELLEAQKQLDNLRLNQQREIAEAADFVLQKLPERFDSPRIALNWTFMQSSTLGGDMFGLEKLNDDQYLIYLLDVAGHGIGASLLAVSIQNTLRQMLADTHESVSPAAILEHLNRSFQMESNQNRFFTMWCGIVDLKERQLKFANGGHLAPVIFDESGRQEAIGQNSLMIGIVPHAKYVDETTSYGDESNLVVFSDGITERTQSRRRAIWPSSS